MTISWWNLEQTEIFVITKLIQININLSNRHKQFRIGQEIIIIHTFRMRRGFDARMNWWTLLPGGWCWCSNSWWWTWGRWRGPRRWKMEGILMIIHGFGFGSVWAFLNICLTSILKLYQTDKHFFLYFAFHIAQVHLNLVNK